MGGKSSHSRKVRVRIWLQPYRTPRKLERLLAAAPVGDALTRIYLELRHYPIAGSWLTAVPPMLDIETGWTLNARSTTSNS